MYKDHSPTRGGRSSDEEIEIKKATTNKKIKWSNNMVDEHVTSVEKYEQTNIGPFKVNVEYLVTPEYNFLTTLKTGQILKDKLKIKEVIDIKRFSKKNRCDIFK